MSFNKAMNDQMFHDSVNYFVGAMMGIDSPYGIYDASVNAVGQLASPNTPATDVSIQRSQGFSL